LKQIIEDRIVADHDMFAAHAIRNRGHGDDGRIEEPCADPRDVFCDEGRRSSEDAWDVPLLRYILRNVFVRVIDDAFAEHAEDESTAHQFRIMKMIDLTALAETRTKYGCAGDKEALEAIARGWHSAYPNAVDYAVRVPWCDDHNVITGTREAAAFSIKYAAVECVVH
jgi:hypothetical protein